MTRFAALISYRGTKYCGFQRQGDVTINGSSPSIQETLEEAFFAITQEKISVVPSGRTDAGVHALGQVIHFDLKLKVWAEETLRRALNARLPKSIRVLRVSKVDPSFHAQRSAIKKQYAYFFQQGPAPLIHLEPFSSWKAHSLNVTRMDAAAQYLKGEHDFKPFQASGSQAHKPTLRQIFEIKVAEEVIAFPQISTEGFSLISIRLVGSGFLKQMVRGIAGTLLQVGEESRDVSIFKTILEQQNRSLLGATAPAKGLWLEKVWYESDPFR